MLLFLLLLPTVAVAQDMCPAWMRSAFVDSVVGDTNARLRAAVTSTAARHNSFLGIVRGTVQLVPGGRTMDFTLWADSTRALVDMHFPQGSLACMVDEKEGIVLWASEQQQARKALVMDFADALRWNNLLKFGTNAPQGSELGHERVIIGQRCMRHMFVAGTDTILYWSAQDLHSPFLDAWNWLPLVEDNPGCIMHKFGALGPALPMRVEMPWRSPYANASNIQLRCIMELTEVRHGAFAPPLPDLAGHALKDEQGKKHAAGADLPARYQALLKQPLGIFLWGDGLERLEPPPQGSGTYRGKD